MTIKIERICKVSLDTLNFAKLVKFQDRSGLANSIFHLFAINSHQTIDYPIQVLTAASDENYKKLGVSFRSLVDEDTGME